MDSQMEKSYQEYLNEKYALILERQKQQEEATQR